MCHVFKRDMDDVLIEAVEKELKLDCGDLTLPVGTAHRRFRDSHGGENPTLTQLLVDVYKLNLAEVQKTWKAKRGNWNGQWIREHGDTLDGELADFEEALEATVVEKTFHYQNMLWCVLPESAKKLLNDAKDATCLTPAKTANSRPGKRKRQESTQIMAMHLRPAVAKLQLMMTLLTDDNDVPEYAKEMRTKPALEKLRQEYPFLQKISRVVSEHDALRDAYDVLREEHRRLREEHDALVSGIRGDSDSATDEGSDVHSQTMHLTADTDVDADSSLPMSAASNRSNNGDSSSTQASKKKTKAKKAKKVKKVKKKKKTSGSSPAALDAGATTTLLTPSS